MRAEQTLATRARIFDAAYDLLMSLPYDDVTLESLAEAAGVTVKTVLRHVGSKEGLLVGGAPSWMSNEEHRRDVDPGDVEGITRVLAERYEQIGAATLRFVALADRLPLVAELVEEVRQGHRAWLQRVFAPWLVGRPSTVRARRVAQLYSATEIYSWVTWRRRLGLSATQAERSLREHLQLLVSAWELDE